MALLTRLVSAEEKRADLEAAGSRKREEVRFKVESALPDITIEDPVATLEAFDKFERGFGRSTHHGLPDVVEVLEAQVERECLANGGSVVA